MRAFLQAQAARIDRGQTNLVARQSDVGENLAHFRQAEDDRQFLLRRWSHEVEDGPLFFQRALVRRT